MNVITLYMVIAALIVTLIAVVYTALKDRKKTAEEIKNLKAELEFQRLTSKDLCHYIEEVLKIKDDKDKVAEQISEAKNEEEVLNIITSLVHANNNRVRKQTSSKA